MLATGWALYAIAGLVVIVRLYTQLKIICQTGWGDAVMVLAVVGNLMLLNQIWEDSQSKVFGILQMIFLQLSHKYGLGRHFFYLTPYEKVMAMEMEFISEPFGK